MHKAHIKNFQRITLIKEIQYLESIVRLLKKFNFTKQISAFSFFLSLKADIFLYFGETNTVIKLSRNPKQKYCYFKDSSSPLRFLLRREQRASLLRSDLSRVPMPHCHIIHCLQTRLTSHQTSDEKCFAPGILFISPTLTCQHSLILL